MSKLEKILALVRSINQDEFQEQLTYGDSLDDVYDELLFLAEKIDSKKKRTSVIVEQISNCFAGDFFNYLPISDAHDELDVFCMGFNTYIEELKAAMVSKKLVETINEKLVEEKDRTDKLTLSRNEFLFNVSHEIRTPLNGILGFTDLLLKNPALGSEEKNQLEYIRMSGAILLVIINDILDLVKMDAKQLVFSNKPFQINQLIRVVQETFLIKFQQKQIDFQVSIDEELPTVLNGDSTRITQILFNLINNAIQGTAEKGSIRLKVKFQDEEDDFYLVRIVVSNSGTEIAEDKLAEVFNPFVQMSDDSNSGLSLTVVKRIVSLMKGDIQVKSKPGDGTKFIITLPFSKNDYYFSVSKSFINKKPIDKNRPVRVLLAEDNRMNQILVEKLLSQFNMNCVAVANGQLAIDVVIQEDFDVIIMDLMMPVMNGYEATSTIRSLKDHTKKNIPIIALSAVVNSTVAKACKAVGINKYISKPFDSDELHAALMELIRRE
ncbi:hypothetical protein GCM10008015_01630 [Flavobacterium palustre]|uniref:histidine kinase n=1 Tax=Flavobacterium palustre TaxID=1476463 RepID=A0ABQ1H8B8_9FLAO|nr:response regulator [Flavobacterium palustre]GGA64440.1 hypothetical protein GCM10008015_01630 [Flavobacterium palustre]